MCSTYIIILSVFSCSGAITLVSGSVPSSEFSSHNCMFAHFAVRLALCYPALGHNFKNESRGLKSAAMVVVQ